MSRIPLEEVARQPQPGAVAPRAIAFAPGDRHVTWLASEPGDLVQQLYAVDLDTLARRPVVRPPEPMPEQQLPLEEQLRRERLRERAVGVTRYAWSARGGRLLVPLGGDLLVQDGLDGAPRVVVRGGDAPILDPLLSPDGARVAFVRDAELYVAEVDGGEPVQLTSGARGTGRTHGLPEYVAQEEMGRMRGFWWARDGTWLAFTEVDETHIPSFPIAHPGKATPTVETHRYPFAGAENARVRLGVVPAHGGAPAWMDLTVGGTVEAEYLARVHPMPDGGLIAEVQDRRQRRLDVIRFDVTTGRGEIVLTERGEPWINLHHLFRPLRGGRFLWGSERSGFMHLYVVGDDGVRQLTSGPWRVDAVRAVDQDGDRVFFSGTKDGPTERHLYVVPLSGGEPRRLTAEPGQHLTHIDRGKRRFVDVHTSVGQQPRVTLRSLDDGRELAVLHETDDPRVRRLGLRPPELVTLESRDGVPLHAALWVPEGEGPFPTIVHVYGGPRAQRVVNDWTLTADLRAQHLRERGFLVVRLDNRGSARRGLAFEAAIAGNMGDVEIRDQIDGVRHLVAQGLADPGRVGIYGWSYGGYLSAMALCRAPDVFHAAVSGAPVTHWDGYDTHYTERYMGLPAENPHGYEVSSVMHHVGAMTGRLLLVHGMIDENVHFRHSGRLIQALVEHRKPHELLLFPNERHMPRGEADRAWLEERIVTFFTDALCPATA